MGNERKNVVVDSTRVECHPSTRKSGRTADLKRKKADREVGTVTEKSEPVKKKRRLQDRWFYEPVIPIILVFPPADRFLVRPIHFLPVSFNVFGVGFADVGIVPLDELVAVIVGLVDGSATEGFEAYSEAVSGQAVDYSVSNSEVEHFGCILAPLCKVVTSALEIGIFLPYKRLVFHNKGFESSFVRFWELDLLPAE